RESGRQSRCRAPAAGSCLPPVVSYSLREPPPLAPRSRLYYRQRTTMTTAALVDDHPVFRQGLKLLFELHGDPRVVAETSLPHEAAEMVRKSRSDVVLLDLVFTDGVSAVSVAHELLPRTSSELTL